jgi:2-polyprenyl-3-methyl-5-hydroxy-6-metoxy-1,4-benzoquinol methylase
MQETNAVSFHNSISRHFSDKYKSSPDFIERRQVWEKLLDKYIKPGFNVLDAGCGAGIFSIMSAEIGANVLGIDGSEAMIEICKEQKAGAANDLTVEFKCAMLPAEPILNKDSYFDVIISSSVLEYINPLNPVMETFKRVIKKDGILILSFPNKQGIYRKAEKIFFNLTGKPGYYAFVHNTYTLNEFEGYCKIFGFSLIESDFYGGRSFLNKMTAWMGDKISKNICVVVLKNNN